MIISQWRVVRSFSLVPWKFASSIRIFFTSFVTYGKIVAAVFRIQSPTALLQPPQQAKRLRHRVTRTSAPDAHAYFSMCVRERGRDEATRENFFPFSSPSVAALTSVRTPTNKIFIVTARLSLKHSRRHPQDAAKYFRCLLFISDDDSLFRQRTRLR